MRTKRVTFFAALLLGVIALLHMLRIFNPIPIIIGVVEIPIWISAIVFVVSGTLSCYLFNAARKLPK